MAEITPILDRAWINERKFSTIVPLYGRRRLCIKYLPTNNIMPEHLAKVAVFDVELMVALMRAGAWVHGDWKTYCRYAINNRLRNRADIIFIPPFDSIKKEFLDFQLNGGTFKTRDKIRQVAAQALTQPGGPSLQEKAVAKLFLSVTDSVEDNACIQPFHWIRAACAASDIPVFGMTVSQVEMQKQKLVLAKMMASKV